MIAATTAVTRGLRPLNAKMIGGKLKWIETVPTLDYPGPCRTVFATQKTTFFRALMAEIAAKRPVSKILAT
jgi:hypothetical protein